MVTVGLILVIIGLIFVIGGHSSEKKKQYKWNNYTAHKFKDYDSAFEEWKKKRGL